MRTGRHLVIMAKVPRLGRVKRRLAADIGGIAALGFYRSSLASVVRRLRRDPHWKCWLYISPEGSVKALRVWPRGLPRRTQGRGDLGARMRRPLRELPPGPVVIVGSDIPEIERRHIGDAFRALGSHDLVFGPAADGGYWLVGARRRPRLPPLFHNVRWSSAYALSDTLAGLTRQLRVALLAELDDVDDGESYSRWRKRAQLARFRCS
jgi:uncharacterized protein